MTLEQVLPILTFIGMLIASVFVAMAGRERQAMQRLIDQRDAEVTRQFQEITRRLDAAGKRTSDLTAHVQVIPDRIRGEFLPRDIAETWVEESRRDRQEIHKAIEDLRRPWDGRTGRRREDA